MTKNITNGLADLELPVERGCPFAPPAAYERLRERAPINKVRLTSGGEAWWVAGHEEARAVLGDAVAARAEPGDAHALTHGARR